MPPERDVPLPLASDADVSPWAVEQEPTTLICLWPGDQPVQTEVLAAIAAANGGSLKLLEELANDDPKVHWNAVVEPWEEKTEWITWCEPARPLPPGELNDPVAEECRWVVGIETMLDQIDPYTHYISIMRLLCAAMPQCPGILDVNTTHWYPHEELQSIFAEGSVDPPAEILWTIHAVSPRVAGDRSESQTTTWLHTHGLWRCGRPELELLEVPGEHTRMAADLINLVADLVLEVEPPPPGESFEIGSGLQITLQPWQTVAPHVSARASGGMKDRTSNLAAGHTGVRAVLCAWPPDGSSKAKWTWPREVIQQLSSDEATVYRSTRATERQAAIARATWSELATAHAAVIAKIQSRIKQPHIVFLLKIGFVPDHGDADDDSPSREHLWFEVRRFDRDRALVVLLNRPHQISHLKEGDETWVERAALSDWTVHCPSGSLGPHRIAELWQMIDALKHSK